MMAKRNVMDVQKLSRRECKRRFRDPSSCEFGLVGDDRGQSHIGRYRDLLTGEIKRYDVVDRKMVVVVDVDGGILVEDEAYA
ncbi:hypothetical protein TH8_19660 [Thalassospira profundimaris]|nr:hypothetical protein TH8_19660 [Thalassospira profundimaris]